MLVGVAGYHRLLSSLYLQSHIEMASLWNKLTLPSRTSVPNNKDYAPHKSTRKHSLSARSRKSLAQIFPSVHGDPSTDKEYVLALPCCV